MEILFINPPAVFKNKLPLLLFRTYDLFTDIFVFFFSFVGVAQQSNAWVTGRRPRVYTPVWKENKKITIQITDSLTDLTQTS